MTTSVARRRGRLGQHPKSRNPLQNSEGKVKALPEYLDKPEIDALLAAAPNPRARLLMLLQWRAGLRVSEALAVRRADLKLGVDRPTLYVGKGKGYRARYVPVHAELENALTIYLGMLPRGHDGPLVDVSRQTAWQWVKRAARVCEAAGQLATGRRVKTHTLRHSYARHLLTWGVPINYLSRWMGHANLGTTLIYLELLPDPAGVLAGVP